MGSPFGRAGASAPERARTLTGNRKISELKILRHLCHVLRGEIAQRQDEAAQNLGREGGKRSALVRCAALRGEQMAHALCVCLDAGVAAGGNILDAQLVGGSEQGREAGGFGILSGLSLGVEGDALHVQLLCQSLGCVHGGVFFGGVSQPDDRCRHGEALLLHCAHRNPSVPDDWDNSMAVENSMVHEIDVLRWLLGEDYATAEVRYGKSTNNGPKDLHDPQIMILTTKSGVRIDVESFVNNKNDYDIKCEIVCDGAVLNMPKPNYISVNANATTGQAMYTDCFQRFADAYNAEIQTWINASKAGYVDGPTAWDGYCCQVAAAAASKARETQTIQPVVYDEMPDFYKK